MVVSDEVKGFRVVEERSSNLSSVATALISQGQRLVISAPTQSSPTAYQERLRNG